MCTRSRKNPFSLLIALDDNEMAEGRLFLDDGESLLTYENKKYTLLTFIVSNVRMCVCMCVCMYVCIVEPLYCGHHWVKKKCWNRREGGREGGEGGRKGLRKERGRMERGMREGGREERGWRVGGRMEVEEKKGGREGGREGAT